MPDSFRPFLIRGKRSGRSRTAGVFTYRDLFSRRQKDVSPASLFRATAEERATSDKGKPALSVRPEGNALPASTALPRKEPSCLQNSPTENCPVFCLPSARGCFSVRSRVPRFLLCRTKAPGSPWASGLPVLPLTAWWIQTRWLSWFDGAGEVDYLPIGFQE